jgi:hypothetical protein
LESPSSKSGTPNTERDMTTEKDTTVQIVEIWAKTAELDD